MPPPTARGATESRGLEVPPATAPRSSTEFRQQPGPAGGKFATVPIFQIHALPAGLLAEVRAVDADTTGGSLERVVAKGGEPLRCCLHDAEPGAPLILFNYTPTLPESPYREAGAVFVHAEVCAGLEDVRQYPSDWVGRPQVLRAYDRRGWVHPATTTHDGTEPERAIAQVLAQPGVVLVHSRNVAYGCYMFAITGGEMGAAGVDSSGDAVSGVL